MGFDITGLSSYVSNNSKEYAMKSVASAKTAKELIGSKNVQFGVKGTTAILKLNSDVSFVSNATCGSRTGGSTITLSNKNITVRQIADEANICVATLWNTFYADSIAKGQSPQEELLPEFANTLMNERAEKIAAQTDKLLWQGVYGSTGVTANLRMIDGIGVQVTGSTSAATGSTRVEQLQNFFLACDVDVRSQDDFRIFISEEIYAEYLVALAGKNIYKPVDDMTLFGTTAKLFVTSGLNGNGRKIYGMRLSNIQLGLDGEGDADSAELRYSIETKYWYQDFKFAIGVAVIWYDEAKYATLAAL